ncbi:MAG TPA: ABC transporter permease [Verrucomicrobiae bacterium]|nr:ABC transporter permease [Verrucomicrobiae bacterium]
MLTNYLKSAWRRLRKDKGFFLLNFSGLYISVTACLLIALLIIYETSFDKNAAGGLEVFRIVNQFSNEHGPQYNAVTPYPLATALRAAMPGEKSICQIHYEKTSTVQVPGGQVQKAGAMIFVDSVYPRLFPLTLRSGSLDHALSDKGYVVLTETAARRYFGAADPVGRRMKLEGLVDVTVAAVVADPAPNTHLPFEMLVSYPSLTKDMIGGFPLDEWGVSASGYAYIGLSGGGIPGQVAQTERILAGLVKENLQSKDPTNKSHYKLQPVRRIHYDTDFAGSNPGYTINSSYLMLLAAIGLFLILAACINYTNLSTALALKKSKEVGVRKTLGATRMELMRQMFTETFVLTGIVVGASAITAGFFLPALNRFLDKQIPTAWVGWTSAGFLVTLWVLVSLLSGIYPAFVLSRFNPVTALKSKVSTPKASMLFLRRGLVVFQFMTAQILIICAFVVSRQMQYVRSQPLGFNKNLIVDVDLPNNKTDKARAFRSRLENIRGIGKLSFSVGAPITDNHIGTGFNRQELFKQKQLDVQVKTADRDYLNVYGLQLVAGRWFNAEDEARVAADLPDSLKKFAFVLNEAAVRALGYKSPQDAIGRMVTFGFNNLSAPVIGVTKDYHLASMRTAVSSVIMVPFPELYYNVGMQLTGGYTPATMDAIERAFNEVYPDQLFNAHFLDEDVTALYKEDRRTQQLFELFTGLSIAINILGLVGLLAFMIEQKTKEVGIRKVLGASFTDISFLLTRDFLRLIGIAFLVAAPLAALLMTRWLNDFAYRTSLGWQVFAGALFCTVAVTCMAVSFQTVRAALRNPVKALRSE